MKCLLKCVSKNLLFYKQKENSSFLKVGLYVFHLSDFSPVSRLINHPDFLGFFPKS